MKPNMTTTKTPTPHTAGPFTREIVCRPAFDKRHADPKKNYGIHGVEMCWYLKGEHGVIQFVIHTNWMLQETYRNWLVPNGFEQEGHTRQPMAADIGYHALTPQFDGQTVREDCPFLEGKSCYYDGSTLQAEPILETLIREGSEAVWKEMERRYAERLVPTAKAGAQ